MTATLRIIISTPISVKLKEPLLAAINLKCQLSPPLLILVGGAVKGKRDGLGGGDG